MKKFLFSTSVLFVAIASIMLIANSCQKDADVYGSLETEVVPYEFGCLPLPVDTYNSIPVAPTSGLKTVPTSVTLVTPPIGNQGGEGSCVAWGTTYAARSTSYQNTNGGIYSTSTNIFSPEYVYNQIKASSDCGSGSYVTTGLDLLVDQGACTWDDMPYTDVSCSLLPDSYQTQQAANYKISTYQRVTVSEAAIKDQLAQGKIVVVAGPVYSSFMYLADGAVQTSIKGRKYGGHCYACVGYDDAKGAFKVMNSWGTSWASDGFGWIAYGLIPTVWSEAYVIYE